MTASEPSTDHPRRCPDDGRCWHWCVTRCWRVGNAGPLSGVFPDDRWPEAVRAEHTEPAAERERAALVPVTVPRALPAGDELPDPGAYELDPDDSRYPRLTWTQRGEVWRSGCGRFAIARVRLPEWPERYPGSSEVYLVRRLDPLMLAQYPQDLGYHLDQALNLAEAMTAAERWAWVDDQGDAGNVPEDYPALALARFYWPITPTCRQGVRRGALVVEREGGRLVARVIGMSRGPDDRYWPGVYAEVDLTALVTDAAPAAEVLWVPGTLSGRDMTRLRRAARRTGGRRRRWWNPADWWRRG